jgi:hypothetical protein
MRYFVHAYVLCDGAEFLESCIFGVRILSANSLKIRYGWLAQTQAQTEKGCKGEVYKLSGSPRPADEDEGSSS